jgi:predicted amidohydrolase
MEDLHTVRICSAQITGEWENPEKTLKKAGIFVRHAADSGAALVCFPEQFATGWDPCSGAHAEDIDGGIVAAFMQMAKDHHIAILGSLRERGEGLPRNTAIVIGGDGMILAKYAKIHLFSPGGEARGFSPGSELGLFPLGPLRCGIAICYDLRFPELFRLYAKNGVQAVFVPAAWPASRMKHWELFITARACENQMYVTGINTTGKTPVDQYSGGSMTADPHGVVISRANGAEQLLFCDIDPAVVTTARTSFPVAKDCRDDLYHTLSGRKT